ncbi:c-type cytochrome [Inhella proteolytica]|uniref:Cytochrome c n=1 Tax=Inhella proteolytica TaxID=2795029 RepID=A0A931NHN1_9BURK|nr:c-type cytochrome [Inhella proteolytica]MBH9577234.1 cytochrome c [Inhella proteolytica]
MVQVAHLLSGLACAALAVAAGAQTPRERVDFGKREFESKCAACHGVSGKGNGPLAELLTRRTPDLTLLAKQNGGVLPIARMYEAIEAGNLPAHGTRDMPVWGREYRLQAGEYYGELPYDPEAYVRARILTLIEYVHRIQAK